MKTDSWIGSVVWGRIGGAVMLILAFVLQGVGIDFSADDQQQAFGAIQTILASIGALMILISKYREKKKDGDQSGRATVLLVAVMLSISLITAIGFAGCAHKTATEQISSQTSDPRAIAKAIYLDSLAAFNDVLETYEPYADLIKETNPAAYIVIYDKLMKADAMLKDFKRLSMAGLPQDMDKGAFRVLIRDLSIEIAKQLDKEGDR